MPPSPFATTTTKFAVWAAALTGVAMWKISEMKAIVVRSNPTTLVPIAIPLPI
jgi:hypothetical protein